MALTMDQIFNNDLNYILAVGKRPKIKEFINDWITRHEGKVPDTFMPYEEWRDYCNSKAVVPYPPEEDHWINISTYQKYTWSYVRYTARFYEEAEKIIMVQKPDGKLPGEVLRRLPHWTIRIPLLDDINSPRPQDKPGDIAACDLLVTRLLIEGKDALVITVTTINLDKDRKPTDSMVIQGVMDIDKPTIEEGIESLVDYNYKHGLEGSRSLEMITAAMKTFIYPVLYVCSEQEPIPQSETVKQHHMVRPKQKGKTWALQPASRNHECMYGLEVVESMVRHRQQLATYTGRKPHVRRAHFHGYWTGPRNGPRQYIYHWIPPVIVSGSVADE